MGIPGLITWLAALGVMVVSAWKVYTAGRRVSNTAMLDG